MVIPVIEEVDKEPMIRGRDYANIPAPIRAAIGMAKQTLAKYYDLMDLSDTY
jgi:hypothetical protein